MNPAVENRPVVKDCPEFKCTGPREDVRLLYRMCVWATDWIEVVGDPDNGCYEWIHRDENGKILKHSDSGYGMTTVALRDGLNAALDGLDDPCAPLLKALREIKKTCLTTPDLRAGMGHVIRLCIDAGVKEKLPDL
jgi:hypothetical protein